MSVISPGILTSSLLVDMSPNRLTRLRLGKGYSISVSKFIRVSGPNYIRMQSLEARQNYKNSFVCAARIFKDEGVMTLWSGAVPRLARLILSGGIVFTM